MDRAYFNMKLSVRSCFLFLLFFSLINETRGSDDLENRITFPEGFHKGVALSAYQNGGNRFGASNWSVYEETKRCVNLVTFFGPAIKNNDHAKYSADFWQYAFDDVQRIKELGCNSFRFSIEWSEIEPEQGVINEDALLFYERLCDELIRNNISPMITLYHWVHPQWFEELGGFRKAENISLFVDFCAKIFERLSSKVTFWCTINEPTVVAACGYVLGIHAPGKCLKFTQSGTVLQNLLNAHVEVYKTLKAMPEGERAQIGIVHQVLQAECFDHRLASNWLFGLLRNYSAKPIARLLNFAFAHAVVKRFLKTGEFEYCIPGLGVKVKSYHLEAPQTYDFIGLNFYSKVILGPTPTCYDHQTMTDMAYPICPETIYDAIADMAELQKPIYITENGIADADDSRRAEFIKDYIGYVHKAIQDGYDVRGYYYWTLIDNFEWNDGYSMKFGLYSVDKETQKRTLRPGSAVYRDMVQVAGDPYVQRTFDTPICASIQSE